MSEGVQKVGQKNIQATAYSAPGERQKAAKPRVGVGHLLLMLAIVVTLLFVLFLIFARSVEVNAVEESIELKSTENEMVRNANVTLDSTFKLPIGRRFLVLSGSHKGQISAPGYLSRNFDITVDSEAAQSFDILMDREPGQLQIDLKPNIDAQVLIDGQTVGELPGLIKEVLAGSHQLTISAPLYRNKTVPILVQGKGQTESITLELEPAWAEYEITSVPAGANLLVDGMVAGQTPINIKLEEGNREIQLELANYKPFSQIVQVLAEQNKTLATVKLKEADGELTVNSEPAGAAVLVAGNYHGTTPLQVLVPANKQHQLQIYKAGYKPATDVITLDPSQQEEKSFQLENDLLPVKISVSPSDSVVTVDGVKRGSGSRTLMLSSLPHTVVVSKNGYVSHKSEIVPNRSSTQLLSVKLLTENEHFWANIKDSYTTRAGQKMRLIRAPGRVAMGSSRRESGRRANEVQYQASLSKHFYVSQHEVTNREYRLFDATHNSGNYKRKSLDASKHPVVNVSWQKAALYCNWLSQRENLTPFYITESGFVSGHQTNANGYRLLTEVEWSWLARAKQDIDSRADIYPWGNADKPSKNRIGNFADMNAKDILAFTLDAYDDGYASSSPVGKFQPNQHKLYDFEGNVSEWVNDWYDPNSDMVGKSTVYKDYLGPEIGEFHVVRGASWAKGHTPQLRWAYRDYGAKGNYDVGFRIARYVIEPKQ